MSKKLKYLLFIGFSLLPIFFLVRFLLDKNIAVLNVAGPIAQQQRQLLIFTAILSVIVVLPVFIMAIHIARKYRVDNHKARYSPDWDGSRTIEAIWWLIPLAIITVLAVITWNSSHDLEPRKQIQAQTETIKIQVVALQWKWLFLYPGSNVATVNYVQMPVGKPVDFEITADAPMNSFWIPQLGGQIYAMSGMSTHLNLMADKSGTYYGSSANLSGSGFAGMKFEARAISSNDYEKWLNQADDSAQELNYAELSKQSENVPQFAYKNSQPGLYDTIVNKYNQHGGNE